MDQHGQQPRDPFAFETMRQRGYRHGVNSVRQRSAYTSDISYGEVSREETAAMEEDTYRLLEDVKRLRDWKDRLARENADMRARQDRQQEMLDELAESSASKDVVIKRLEEEYRTLLAAKVALEERLNGPAKLPVEILLNIAGFVAGNNDYGTLLSFCVMSKRIREETKSTLYETVLVFDTEQMRLESERQRNIEAYRFTKFIYTQNLIGLSIYEKYFPNIHAVILLQKDCSIGVADIDGRGHPPFKAQLRIHRSIRSDTLFSLFRYPFSWGSSPPSIHHTIQAVSNITLLEEGALVPASPPSPDRDIRNLIRQCEIDIRQCRQHRCMEETLRVLGRFAPVLPDRQIAAYETPLFKLIVKGGADLDAALRIIPDVIRRQPYLILKIDIITAETPARAWFRDQCMTAATAYGSIWEEIRPQIDSHRPLLSRENDCFFCMECSVIRQGTPSVELIGDFQYQRSSASFSIRISAIDQSDAETVLLEEPYAMDGGQRRE